MQQEPQTEDSDRTKSTLKATILAMMVSAGLFGYAGYSGLEFPEGGRTDVFVVFVVLATILLIVGSIPVWLEFSPQSILSVSEYRMRPMAIGRRIGCMAFLLGPLLIGSTVYLIGGWHGSLQRAIVAAIVAAVVAAFLCGLSSLIQRLMKAKKTGPE